MGSRMVPSPAMAAYFYGVNMADVELYRSPPPRSESPETLSPRCYHGRPMVFGKIWGPVIIKRSRNEEDFLLWEEEIRRFADWHWGPGHYVVTKKEDLVDPNTPEGPVGQWELTGYKCLNQLTECEQPPPRFPRKEILTENAQGIWMDIVMQLRVSQEDGWEFSRKVPYWLTVMVDEDEGRKRAREQFFSVWKHSSS